MAGFSLYHRFLVIVGATTLLTDAAKPQALRHGRSVLAAMQTVYAVQDHASELPLSVEISNTIQFSGLVRSPEQKKECDCGPVEEKEEDVCTCNKAMQVLKCVSRGCESGDCKCSNRTLVDACEDLASKCDNLKFSCAARKATCDSHEEISNPSSVKKTKNATKEATKENITENETAKVTEDMKSDDNATVKQEEAEEEKKEEVSYDEVYQELASLKEDKCKLQLAATDGYEVDKDLQKVMKQIDQKLEELTKAGQKRPEMHCYKHFEEWHEPSSKDKVAKSGTPVAVAGRFAILVTAGFAVCC